MKIRTSFVSNSSSSSFIIGVGVIPVDYVKEHNLMFKHQTSMQYQNDIKIAVLGDLRKDKTTNVFGSLFENGYLTNESFTGCSVSLNTNNLPDETIIGIYDYYGSEGDCAFSSDDDDCYDADYDIGTCFFDNEQQNIISTMSQFGWDWSIGAGRNG